MLDKDLVLITEQGIPGLETGARAGMKDCTYNFQDRNELSDTPEMK